MTLMVNHLIGFGAGGGSEVPQSFFTAGVTGAAYAVNPNTCFEERTGGGTTPSSVGGVVGAIRDFSGLGNHLVAASDAARGILRQSGSQYYIEFDGVDDTYATANTFTWAYDVFVGATFRRLIQTGNTSLGFLAASNSYAGINEVTTGSRISASHRNPTNGLIGASSASNAAPLATVLVGQALLSQDLAKLQINAGTDVDAAATWNPANLTGSPTIGVNRGATAHDRFYGGIFLMGKTMSTQDRNNARTWLGNLAGLSL